MVDLKLRKEIEAGLKPEQKPKVIFTYYIMSKFTYSNYCVIGTDDEATAWKLHEFYAAKADLEAVSIQKEYPYEVYKYWK